MATTAEVCAVLGITGMTLGRWAAKHGCPKRGRNSWDLDAVRAWMREAGKDGRPGRPVNYVRDSTVPRGGDGEQDEDLRDAYLRAKLRKEIAMASKHELDVLTRRGELLDAADVQRGRLERIAHARAILLGLPSSLALDVRSLPLDAAEELIRERIHGALRELAGEDA